MKKTLKVLFYILLIGVLSGCSLFAPEEKEFSKSGMSIILNDDFVLSENVQMQMYVVSTKHIFMGNGQSKSFLVDQGYADLTLYDYTELVLKSSNKNSAVKNYSDEDTYFKYAYYESAVEGEDYSYMLVCMESNNKFYTMNFGCYTKNFNDDTKEMYLEWAKTIRVE